MNYDKMFLQKLRRRRYGEGAFQRVGAWCEPIAYNRITHHFRAEDPSITVLGSYVSRVKGEDLSES